MKKLWCYTREPIDNVHYDPRLAYSMHLAIEEEGKLIALNHNSGVLFPKGTENEDGSINPKALKYPYIYKINETEFGIMAIRTLPEGEPDEESIGKVLFCKTCDFVSYEEIGFTEPSEEYQKQLAYLEHENDNNSCFAEVPEGAHLCNAIEISDEVADRLCKKLLTPYHVETIFSEKVTAATKEEFCSVKATRVFSDGMTSTSVVDWDLSGVDFTKSGEYTVHGTLHQDHYPFPVATNHADPCIGKWGDKYYFIATYDADHEHTMYIREADSIPELVNAEEILLLDSVTYEGIGGLLWAPEFHIIGGRLCILHAATPDPFFEEESRVMILKEGGNPVNRYDWEGPRRVCLADGTDICEAGKEITLDMTHFVWEGEDYVIWSQRQFLPKDLGAWLYIAKLNPQEPWKLASDPIVLTKPVYAWENNHTFVVEGPFALKREKELCITYSGAAVDTSYVVGLLTLPNGKDPLIPANWKKSNYPILTSRSVEGEFGTGHNAYVEDENGIIWNTYHARPGEEAPRSSGIREVHFDIDDEPMLDVTEELAVNQKIAAVTTLLSVL